MKALTLKHLRYFAALAEHQHFGRAAEACAITQPALSLQIKELEEMVGAPLVERGSRQTRLTPLGERFTQRAGEILLGVEELGELSRAARGVMSGRLRLGVIPTIAPYLLPQMITRLAQHLPDLELDLRESVTQSLVADLREGRLDMALLALPLSEPFLQEFALFEEEFVLVRPSDEQHLPVPSAARLTEMKLLLLEEGHCFRDQALSFCEPTRGAARQVMEGSSLSTLVQMVGAGMGVTLIPEMALGLETRSANVSWVRFEGQKPSRQVGLVWRKSNPLSGQMMELGALLRQMERPMMVAR